MAKFRIALLVIAAMFQIDTLSAQNSEIFADRNLTEDAIKQRVNTGTVTLITGGVDGISNTYQQLAGDLASVLDVRSELRVLPIVGYGSLQNIEDLLFLRGIDIGMVHSDVLKFLDQRKIMPGAKRRLRYITKLYDEPLHLLVNPSITDVKQLDGKTIIIGRPGSGNEMSALTLITELGISPKIAHVEFEEGVKYVQSGEAAAMFVVTRRPSEKIRKVTRDGSVRLMPIPVTKRLAETYAPASLTSEDYPNLIAPGETVETPQMAAVLTVYNWQPGSSRYNNVTGFISNFAAKVSEMKNASRKDIWEKLDPEAPVKGWTRYAPAEILVTQAVAARKKSEIVASQPAEDDQVFRQFAAFVRESNSDKQLNDQQVKEMYARFKLWQQAQQ